MEHFVEAYQWSNLQFLGKGLLMTIVLALTAIVVSFIIGGLLAIFRYSKIPVLRQLAFLYTEIVRNTPLILILFFTFFGLPELGFDLSLFWKLALGLIIFEISQLAEIVRGGLNSIEKGQIEAARSQGVSYVQTLQHIILPQALKRMTPSIVSQFITIVKDTSYTSMFGLLEVLNSAKIIWNQDFDFIFPIIILVAILYFVVNFALSALSVRLEKKWS
ncbi:amino acid ABC transporter permease [Aureibacillus halotolerans]|uniref:Amino acid ABC transporter membrane protein 2 (PAAT family) n=1 Tax=Aureibacillus halotolerans TaxID=1508390 RepID=A0A4R6U333_9BACI|nr:amino acid ABC transporter permease [Aureibacillus halotolerans]TDQ40858.1 amino acid ABC transporter membrane protein 2 (PAAT family) [Aureibacillus halotolerans]